MPKTSNPKPTSQVPAGAERRDWISIGLALAGVLLASYLYYAHQSGELAGCVAGGACDSVQQSRWSVWLGISIPLWGVGLYGVLGVLWWLPPTAQRRLAILTITGAGVAISGYLTAMVRRDLGVSCPYCLASFALLVVLAGQALWAVAPRERGWWGALAGIVALIAVGIVHWGYARVAPVGAVTDQSYLDGLAKHLRDSDVKFYGASWCPHCKEQKALFGAAAAALPYIECSPHGPGTPQATTCMTAGITSYPSWVIRGQRYARLMLPDRLAALTGYAAPPAPKSE